MLRQHWRKALIGALLALPVLAALGWFVVLPWYVRSDTYRPEIERQMGEALGLQVKLGSLGGGVLSDAVLRDVECVDPATGEKVLSIAELRLAYDGPTQLQEGKLRSLAVIGPRLRLTHERARGWRWRRLGAWLAANGIGGAPAPEDTPPADAPPPVLAPASAGKLTVEGLEVTLATDELVAKLSGLDLDAGAVALDAPFRVTVGAGARLGLARPLDADLDPKALDAAPFALGCEEISANLVGDRPTARVKGLTLAGADLAALVPVFAVLGLHGGSLSSGPAQVRLDAELADGRVTIASVGAAPGLKLRPEGEKEPYAAGGSWELRAIVTLETDEVQVDRLRVATEDYGTWEAQGTGALATQEVLVRSLSAQRVDLAALAGLAAVRAAEWRLGGVVDLGDGSGRFRRDARTGEWELNAGVTAIAERLAAAFRTDAAIVQGADVEVKVTLGLDTRAGTCVVGAVGSASRLAHAGGGFEVRGDGGADGIVFRGSYRWREGIFQTDQVDARVRDLVVSGLGGGRALVMGEPVTVGFVREAATEDGRPVKVGLDYHAKTGRLRFAGLRLTPRRGGELTVSADLSLETGAFASLDVEGRRVELPFVQATAQRTLGWKAPYWTVSGQADFAFRVRPDDAEGKRYHGNYVLKSADLALEALVDAGPPIGLAGDLDGKFRLDPEARTLALSNGHARLGNHGQADYRLTLDLASGWPVDGTVDLYAMDGGWTWDLARRALRVGEETFEGKGQINGRITFGTPRRGEVADARLHFKGNLTQPWLASRHYDVDLSGGQIAVEAEIVLPDRTWTRPVVSATLRATNAAAQSKSRLYEGEKINLRAAVELRFDREAETVAGEADLRVERAEFLWDTIYDEIQKDPIVAQLRGSWAGKAELLTLERFDVQHPNFGFARGSGRTTVRRIEHDLVFAGVLDLADSSLVARKVTVAGMTGRIPFWVGYPSMPEGQTPEGLRDSDWAKVRVQGLELGGFRMEALDVEFAWVGHRVLTRRPLELPVCGGTVRFNGFSARGLIPRGLSLPYEPEWRADSIEVVDFQPGLALYMAGVDRPVSGKLSGRIDKPRFDHKVMDLRGGELTGALMGGKAVVRDVQVRAPLGRWRLECSVEGTGFELLEACRMFPEVGEIEGKVDLRLAGLQVLEGTPVAFELDLDNSAWSGEGGRQTIDHHAARALGTFSGGVSAMFEDTVKKRTFKYIHFGVVARMQYHPELSKTFVRMRGKYRKQWLAFPPIATYKHLSREDLGPDLDVVVEGEEEYFLVGATTSGVNLINGQPRGLVDYVEIFDRAKRVIERGKEGIRVK